jgi:hypothetical protein
MYVIWCKPYPHLVVHPGAVDFAVLLVTGNYPPREFKLPKRSMNLSDGGPAAILQDYLPPVSAQCGANVLLSYMP